MDEYLKSRYEWIKTFARVRIGLKQLIYRPYYNMVWMILIVTFFMAWKRRKQLVSDLPLPVSLHQVAIQMVSVLLVLSLTLLVMAFLRVLGERASRRDESCLIIAFTGNDLRNGHPILLSRKRIKGTNVLVREFYSNIPMSRWKERKEELEDAFNGRFVKPFIEYGGKRKNNSKRIVVYVASGRTPVVREIMYDKEL